MRQFICICKANEEDKLRNRVYLFKTIESHREQAIKHQELNYMPRKSGPCSSFSKALDSNCVQIYSYHSKQHN